MNLCADMYDDEAEHADDEGDNDVNHAYLGEDRCDTTMDGEEELYQQVQQELDDADDEQQRLPVAQLATRAQEEAASLLDREQDQEKDEAERSLVPISSAYVVEKLPGNAACMD